jgi:hypothetical protein
VPFVFILLGNVLVVAFKHVFIVVKCRACGTYGGGERCAQGSGGETCGKETIGETEM